MISMVSLDSKTKEIKPLEACVRDVAAVLTDDKWNISIFDNLDEFDKYVSERPLVDLSCFDVTPDGAVDSLMDFRKNYDQAFLMLIADPTVSPLVYLNPGIRPDSLMMRPLTKDTVKGTLKDFISSYVSSQEDTGSVKSFVIDSKEGKIAIPYNDIYYFEAREKKIFIRTMNDEYGFYETIENLEETIPDAFMRCHRSFIVNSAKIRKIMLSQNIMELSDGFDVPLSRSYKPLFKSFGKV